MKRHLIKNRDPASPRLRNEITFRQSAAADGPVSAAWNKISLKELAVDTATRLNN